MCVFPTGLYWASILCCLRRLCKFFNEILELTIVEIAHRVISNILICFILLFSFFSWNLFYYTWINGQNWRLFKEYWRFLRTFSFFKDFQVPLKWLFEFQHYSRSSRTCTSPDYACIEKLTRFRPKIRNDAIKYTEQSTLHVVSQKCCYASCKWVIWWCQSKQWLQLLLQHLSSTLEFTRCNVPCNLSCNTPPRRNVAEKNAPCNKIEFVKYENAKWKISSLPMNPTLTRFLPQ